MYEDVARCLLQGVLMKTAGILVRCNRCKAWIDTQSFNTLLVGGKKEYQCVDCTKRVA